MVTEGTGSAISGGFRRASQSLRVVDRLEKRYLHAGLNLTDDVREGLFKSGPADRSGGFDREGLNVDRAPGLETQVVLLADRIAAAAHDLDDALQSGAITLRRIERLSAIQQLRRKLGSSYGAPSGAFMKISAIHRGLIHLLVTGSVLHGGRSLARWSARHGIDSHERFLERREKALRGQEIVLLRPPSGACSTIWKDSSNPGSGAATRQIGLPDGGGECCSGCSPPTTPIRPCCRITSCCASRKRAASGSCATFHGSRSSGRSPIATGRRHRSCGS